MSLCCLGLRVVNANADPSPGWSSRPDPRAGQSPGLHRVHDRGQGKGWSPNPGQNHGQEQDKSQGLEVSRTSR